MNSARHIAERGVLRSSAFLYKPGLAQRVPGNAHA